MRLSSIKAGIVYTDKKYKSSALSLNTFKGVKDCRVDGCFQELVLTDYTVQQLLDIDPKLIVLAPFTLATTTKKESVLSKGREWGDEVTQVFPPKQQQSALNASLPVFKNAEKSLVKEGKIGHSMLVSVLSILAIITGQSLALTVAIFFYHFGGKFLAKTQDHSKKMLTHLFDQQPSKVWILKNKVEIEVPLKDVCINKSLSHY
ncbi:MAG: hypothetical protein ABFS56_14830 [Pseudomonadota bacterium]